MAASFLHRLHAKVYGGSWNNPLFAAPQKKESQAVRQSIATLTLLITSSCITLATLGYWFLVSDRFLIDEVGVQGMRTLADERIEEQIVAFQTTCKYFATQCMFTWNIQPINNFINTTLNLTITSQTKNTNSLNYEVFEPVTVMLVRVGEEAWYTTFSGELIRLATTEELTLGKIIPKELYYEIKVPYPEEKPFPGMRIAPPETFSFIVHMNEELRKKGIVFQECILSEDPGKITIITSGVALYVNPWDAIAPQLERGMYILSHASPQKYIDLRFGNRVYIR